VSDRVEVASVVLNYGRADLAAAAVDSLLASDLPSSRVLLADNGSPDAERALAEATRRGVPALLLSDNHGFAGGMNLALEEANRRWNPEYFFLLNSDARVEPGTSAELLRAARDRDAHFVGPKILFDRPGPPRIWSAGGDFRRWRAFNRGEGEVDTGRFDGSEEVPFLSGCALLIRREAWERLGGFDPRFFMYQEDADLCLRARRSGLRLLYQGTARVHHVGSATAGDPYADFQSYYRWRNRLLCVGRNTSGPSRAFFFAAYFPALALRDLLRYAVRRRWSGTKALFDGLADFLRGARRPRKPEFGPTGGPESG